jgi:hypothetical protein
MYQLLCVCVCVKGMDAWTRSMAAANFVSTPLSLLVDAVLLWLTAPRPLQHNNTPHRSIQAHPSIHPSIHRSIHPSHIIITIAS